MKKLNMIKIFYVVASSLLLLVFFQNCGEGMDNKVEMGSNSLSDGLDTGVVNYKPIINCMLSSADAYHNVSSITGDNTFSAKKFNVDSIIGVDCRKTSDESSVSLLSIAIDTDYNPGAPNFVSKSGSSFGLSSLSAGIHNMALKITDPQGEISIKDFSLIVECEEGAPAPALESPNTAIKVSQG